MTLNEELGNGGKHRAEIYNIIQDITKEKIPHDLQKKLKRKLLEYVSDREGDVIKRLIDAQNTINTLVERDRLIKSGTHAVCQHCHATKVKRKFLKV